MAAVKVLCLAIAVLCKAINTPTAWSEFHTVPNCKKKVSQAGACPCKGKTRNYACKTKTSSNGPCNKGSNLLTAGLGVEHAHHVFLRCYELHAALGELRPLKAI